MIHNAVWDCTHEWDERSSQTFNNKHSPAVEREKKSRQNIQRYPMAVCDHHVVYTVNKYFLMTHRSLSSLRHIYAWTFSMSERRCCCCFFSDFDMKQLCCFVDAIVQVTRMFCQDFVSLALLLIGFCIMQLLCVFRFVSTAIEGSNLLPLLLANQATARIIVSCRLAQPKLDPYQFIFIVNASAVRFQLHILPFFRERERERLIVMIIV